MVARLGIDIGMCCSKAAFILDNQITLLRDPFNYKTLYPSSIYVDQQGRLSAGAEAETQRLLDPAHYRRYFKWDLREKPELIGGRSVSYEEMMLAIITTMKRDFEDQHGAFSSAILTVPSTYARPQRDLIFAACQKAGLGAVNIIDGPAAVAERYSLDNPLLDEEPLLVYNLGGCFDAAIVKRKGSRYVSQSLSITGQDRVTASGDYNLGGMAFDKKIYDYLEKYLIEIDPAWSEYLSVKNLQQEARQARASLRHVSQNIKHQLSTSEQSTVSFEPGIVGMQPVSCSLSRTEFNALIAPFIDRTIHYCRVLMQQYLNGWNQLSKIVLVGGGANIPVVQATLAQQFARPVHTMTDTTIEAQGAAMYRNAQIPSLLEVGRQTIKSLANLADLFLNDLEPRPMIAVMTYKEAIGYFTTNLPPDPRVQKGAMLQRTVPYGVVFTQVFLDENNYPVLRPDGQPYGRKIFVEQLDNELRNTFGSKLVVLVE